MWLLMFALYYRCCRSRLIPNCQRLALLLRGFDMLTLEVLILLLVPVDLGIKADGEETR
jgi:hypothetical protein